MSMTVNLTEAEWNQLISIIAQAPWSVANPLLAAITRQLQEQKAPQQQTLEQTRTNSGGGIAAPEGGSGGLMPGNTPGRH
jgi:hypothetical protein